MKDRAISKFSVKCPFCEHQNDISGIYAVKKTQKKDDNNEEQATEISSLNCQNKDCLRKLPESFLRNRVTLYLKELISYYYAGNYECMEPSCKTKTR